MNTADKRASCRANARPRPNQEMSECAFYKTNFRDKRVQPQTDNYAHRDGDWCKQKQRFGPMRIKIIYAVFFRHYSLC